MVRFSHTYMIYQLVCSLSISGLKNLGHIPFGSSAFCPSLGNSGPFTLKVQYLKFRWLKQSNLYLNPAESEFITYIRVDLGAYLSTFNNDRSDGHLYRRANIYICFWITNSLFRLKAAVVSSR